MTRTGKSTNSKARRSAPRSSAAQKTTQKTAKKTTQKAVAKNAEPAAKDADNFKIPQEKPKKLNLLFCLLIMLAGICLVSKTFQNDTYYTIAIGENIQSLGVDGAEHFTWLPLERYTYPHWLFDLIVSKAYDLGDFGGVYFLTTLFAALLGLALYLVNRALLRNHLKRPEPLALIFSILQLLLLGSDFLAARTQILSFTCFVLEYFLLESFTKKPKISTAVLLFLDAVLIFNIHAGVALFFFALFLPYFAEFILHKPLALFRKPETEKTESLAFSRKPANEKTEPSGNSSSALEAHEAKSRAMSISAKTVSAKPHKLFYVHNKNVKPLFLVFLACLFAGLLTPNGLSAYLWYPLTLLSGSTSQISEHLPLILADSLSALVAFLIFFTFYIFTSARLRLKDLFLFLGLTIMALSGRRSIALLIILGGLAFLPSVAEWFTRLNKDRILAAVGLPKLKKLKSNNSVKLFLRITIIFCSVFTITFFIAHKARLNEWEFVAEESYPVAAADFAIENLCENAIKSSASGKSAYRKAVAENPGATISIISADKDAPDENDEPILSDNSAACSEIKIYNDYETGPYLLYRGLPVSIDSRCDLYLKEFNGHFNFSAREFENGRNYFSDYLDLVNGRTYYEPEFERLGVTHVLLNKSDIVATYLKEDQNYHELYSDDHFVLYERSAK